MMKIDLKHFITPSVPLVFFYALIAIVLWAFTLMGKCLFNHIELSTTEAVCASVILQNAASFVVTILNTFLVSRLVNRFTFLNKRTFIPVFVFVLLIISWASIHIDYKLYIALLFFIIGLFQFLLMGKNIVQAENAFLGSFFIGIASLGVNDLVYIMPICWLGFLIFQSFTLRTILGSILGVAAPWVLYIAGNYLLFPEQNLLELFDLKLQWQLNVGALPIESLLYAGMLTLIFLICTFGMFTDFHTFTNNTKRHIYFILIVLIFFVVISFFKSNNFGIFLPFIAFAYSILVSHSFSRKQNLFYPIIFILFCCVNLFYIFYSIL